MGINKLQLSAELIAALYPESLVGIEDGPIRSENRWGQKTWICHRIRIILFWAKTYVRFVFLYFILMKSLYPADNWYFSKNPFGLQMQHGRYCPD